MANLTVNIVNKLFKKKNSLFLKQEWLFKEALKEFGLTGDIFIQHRYGKALLNQEEFNVVFPLHLLKRIKVMNKKKVYDYNFIGKYTPDRAWVEEYSKNSFIKFTDEGRKTSKDFFDQQYYQVLCDSKFTLCPRGAFNWSYRFFEAIICMSIPVIDRDQEEDTDTMNGFKYYFQDEVNTHVYDKAVCDYNYKLLLLKNTLLPYILDIDTKSFCVPNQR